MLPIPALPSVLRRVPGVARAQATTRALLALPGRLDRVLRGLEQLDRIDDLVDSAAALPELTTHARVLPELTRNAASLPELAPRMASVEEMVLAIIDYLEKLEPTVEQLTLAAGELHGAVAPISRVARRLPGARRHPGDAPALSPARPAA